MRVALRRRIGWVLPLALASAGGCRDDGPPSYIRLDEKAPSLPGPSSATMRVVSFWATWCAPCREEMPGLIEFARAPPPGLEVVAVSEDAVPGAIEKFFGGPADLALHSRVDHDRELFKAFGVERLPTSFVIYNGRLVARLEGPRRWNSKAMRELMRRLSTPAPP